MDAVVRRDLEFLMPVAAYAHRHVDQLHVVESRFWIVGRRADELLSCFVGGVSRLWHRAQHDQNYVMIAMHPHRGSGQILT